MHSARYRSRYVIPRGANKFCRCRGKHKTFFVKNLHDQFVEAFDVQYHALAGQRQLIHCPYGGAVRHISPLWNDITRAAASDMHVTGGFNGSNKNPAAAVGGTLMQLMLQNVQTRFLLR